MAAALRGRARVRRERRARPTAICTRAGETGRFQATTSASCSARSPTGSRDKFGTKGSPISLSTACASGATAIQLGVEAIRRGETDAALCIGTDGSVNAESLIRFSLLSALSTSNDPPQAASKPFSKNRDGFVMAEGAGALVLESLERRAGARREDPGRDRGLRRDGGLVPPHALEPGRQADHRLHPQRDRRCGPDAGRHRLHQPARHRHAGERQERVHLASRRCSASARRASRSRRTSR